MMYSVIYVSDVEIMILWYRIYIMRSTSGKVAVMSQIYMQSQTFIRAAFLKKYMKVEMYRSQDMLQEGICSHC